jgi:serine/threonine-protein kinase
MEESKKQLLAEARACEKRGDNKGAGDAFARAGAHDDAARVYLAGGFFADAGRTLLLVAGYDVSQPAAVAPAAKGVLLKAAICFSRAGDVGQAVRLFVAVGERNRAAELLRSVGDSVNAARVELQKTGHVDLVGYDRAVGTKPTADLETARRLEATGKHDAAMEIYASQQQWTEAARLARALGQNDRAAGFYSEAGQFFEAAQCHFRARNRDQALACLLKVKSSHPRYREACVQAIETCADRSSLTFDLENLLTAFLASEPVNVDEVDAFYSLALLFETHRSFDNAVACYRKILARDPGNQDARDRLRAAEEEDRGASDTDFRRIVGEEQSFRAAVRRHTTPLVVPGSGSAHASPADPPLPDLPPLPALPQLPGLPTPAAGPTFHVAGAAVPPAESVALKEGTTIANRYRLQKKIGQGGMGVVYKAVDLELDETVAIKFLTIGLSDDEVLGRFKQEVSLSRQFGHPNIIRMYDLGSFGEHRYMTMEYLEGQDLGSLLDAGVLPFARGVELLIQACHALQVVHDHGVVHRDVKPDNFFLTNDGVLKVMDFGIAKNQRTSKGYTRAGTMAGTAQYVAPEQVRDFGSVTHLADIYALGCIAYKMFTGRVPFDGDEVLAIVVAHVSQAPVPPRDLNPEIPADLETVILRLLAKQPEARVQSCRELALILTDLRNRLPH